MIYAGEHTSNVVARMVEEPQNERSILLAEATYSRENLKKAIDMLGSGDHIMIQIRRRKNAPITDFKLHCCMLGISDVKIEDGTFDTPGEWVCVAPLAYVASPLSSNSICDPPRELRPEGDERT